MSTSWGCMNCGLHNNGRKNKCQACFTEQPNTRIIESNFSKQPTETTDVEQYQKLLIHTYCKGIPKDIIQIVFDFYDTMIYWTIPKDQFNKYILFNEDEQTFLIGPAFCIKNIPFCLEFCKYNGFGIVLTSADFKHVNIRLKLCCDQTNTEWRKKVMLFSDNNKQYWPHHIHSMTQWHFVCKDIFQTDKITFGCDLDILSAVYNDINRPTFIKEIRINPIKEVLKFEWNIDNELLKQFKVCDNGKIFYAPNYFGIDDNFCLWCAPNGRTKYDNGKCILLIKLLALPHLMLHGIFVSYTMSVNDNLLYKNEENLDFYTNLCWPVNILSTMELASLGSIKFLITMQIIDYAKSTKQNTSHF